MVDIHEYLFEHCVCSVAYHAFFMMLTFFLLTLIAHLVGQVNECRPGEIGQGGAI